MDKTTKEYAELLAESSLYPTLIQSELDTFVYAYMKAIQETNVKQLQEENERLREVLKRTESMLFHGVTSREAWEFVYNFLNKKP